jgi:aminoglycoside phosphotransferase (APT) family kinase protein
MSSDASIEPRPELAEVRAGEELDWASLERFLVDRLDDVGGSMEVLQFPNGSANLTYLVRFGERRFVVRRPPFGRIAPGAHDMRREFRTLSRLWRGYAPAPRAFLFCDDHSVVGSDFTVIEYRSGEVVWGVVPPSMTRHADVGRRIGLAVVDALADLHLVDPQSVDLAELGRPDGFVERQVRGWAQRWELAALPDSDPLMGAVGERLAATTPETRYVSILHNDYKLDNCQFDPAEPDRVKSVFDWDMATLGDPFVDLGITLNYWPDPSDVDGLRPIVNPGMDDLGMPPRAEVIERYASRTGFDVTEVRWYEAFAAWKTAVVLQQLYARWVRGESTDPLMAERGPMVADQARRAAAILDGTAP